MKRQSVPFAEFKALCEELQCSQAAYAMWVGLDPQTVYAWARKGRIPRVALMPGRLILRQDVGAPKKLALANGTRERHARVSPFAERNAEMCRLLQDGKTLDVIGKRFDVTGERVRQLCKRDGVVSFTHARAAEKKAAKAHRAEIKRERKARFLQLIEDGAPLQRAAYLVGIGDGTATKLARQAGVKRHAGFNRGTKKWRGYNGAEILRLRAEGLSVRDITIKIGAPTPIALRQWCRANNIPLSSASQTRSAARPMGLNASSSDSLMHPQGSMNDVGKILQVVGD